MANENNTYTMEEQVKKLEKTLDDLYAALAKEKPGTEGYKQIIQAIESVNHRIANLNDKIKAINENQNAKIGNAWTAVKVVGTLVLGVIGLGFAHHDDIGDTIPGKYVSKFVDSFIFRRL